MLKQKKSGRIGHSFLDYKRGFYFLNITFSLLNMSVSKYTPAAPKIILLTTVSTKGIAINSPPKIDKRVLTELKTGIK